MMLNTLKTNTLKAKKVIVDYQNQKLIVDTEENKQYYLHFKDLSDNFDKNVIKVLEQGAKL
jgi:hypothetical protein